MNARAQEQVFKKAYAKELLSIARSDLESAKVLLQSKKIRLETVGFHCQQAIEKALKGVLVSLGLPVPLVHDAGILVAKLPSHLTPPMGYDLSQLSTFATQLRYEEGKMELKEKDIEGVIQVALQVLSWAEKNVK